MATKLSQKLTFNRLDICQKIINLRIHEITLDGVFDMCLSVASDRQVAFGTRNTG